MNRGLKTYLVENLVYSAVAFPVIVTAYALYDNHVVSFCSGFAAALAASLLLDLRKRAQDKGDTTQDTFA